LVAFTLEMSYCLKKPSQRGCWMASQDGSQLLLKGRGSAARGMISLGATRAATGFNSRPLFRSIGVSGAGGASQWAVVTFEAVDEPPNPWDACHALISEGPAIAGGGVEFVEPDFVQQWPVKVSQTGNALAAARTGDPHPQDSNYPTKPDNFWFRDIDHGEFADAQSGLHDPGLGVRIAHLDTGYDPDHRTCPVNLSATEQRNFVDAPFPRDARDRSSGPFNNFSHGTGTLSILAGAPARPGEGFGCAPLAQIIPIRVANRVVLFSNSAVAKGFDYVHSLCSTANTRVQVVTMSMGGLPSQAWAEAINALYDAGVFVVAAAGNNYGNFPTRFIVYPARFNRVVAACGVMADETPYADLKLTLMAGDYGPPDKMVTAIATYTPNIPWARYGEPDVVDFDGCGTSAATPQVAGAAALWIQKNRTAYDAYAEPWMRVEALRRVLFSSAAVDVAYESYFGSGRLRAKAALETPPPQATALQHQKADDATDSTFHVLLGLGLDSGKARDRMVGLELRQVLQARGLEQRLAEIETPKDKARMVDELLSFPDLSKALRQALGDRPIPPSALPPALGGPMEQLHLELALDPKPPQPSMRWLRVFAYDPSLQTDIRNFGINETTIGVRWEQDLKPGPIGEYFEVIDVDPASGNCYAPVDLNHPHLLVESGLQPSEANPQFHQQMAYAVAMRTVDNFERALGRRALWAERFTYAPDGHFLKREYVQRLRIYPHALCEQNAFYSRDRMALLLGYFTSTSDEIGVILPNSHVFCAVSHDIIAHETTHALLDGLHPRYQEATNPDMLAFHEAFADIVALLQHFAMPEALLHQIKQNRGDLRADDLLGTLAPQFGNAAGMHGALRSFIGKADPRDYQKYKEEGEPHVLGAVLVSAIFAAFDTIYRARSADLVRLATAGSGILPPGQISDDLAGRLAREAAKVAGQVLNMCVRALDYCPPVDLDFGDYLRAIITADHDLVPDDDRGYRVAFISAFRERGILPTNVRHLAEDSLIWETPPLLKAELDELKLLIVPKSDADWDKVLDLRWSLNTDRKPAYDTSRANGGKVHDWLKKQPTLLVAMGFEPPAQGVSLAGMTGEMHDIEVHSVRPNRRMAPDGSTHAMLVIEITQTFHSQPDGERYRGGCTLLVDLNNNEAKYIVRKWLRGGSGALAQMRARALAAERAADLGLRFNKPGDRANGIEPFALLHRRCPSLPRRRGRGTRS
jgi:hypothetical protein